MYDEGRLSVVLQSKEAFTPAPSAYSSTSHASSPRPGDELIKILIRDAWGLLAPRATDRVRTPYKPTGILPTNNEAEYEALITGLRIAARMGVRNLEANVVSRLVANHVLGEYVAKEDNMIRYLDKTKSLIQGFDRFTIR
ncbi:reverse transcriptase domain-containing protein [Tanacetum coccineum]